MSSTLQLKSYIPIPETITVPLHQMEQILETFPETYAVMWTAGKLNHAKNHEQQADTNQPNTEGNKLKRKRFILHSWYKTFFCHRRGKKEQSRGVLGGKSGVKRPLQKASKKIGCPATMKITCYKKDPNNVVFTFQKQHNHDVGSREDFIFLPVSKSTKDFITQKLVEGCCRKDIRVSIERQLNQPIQNRSRDALAEKQDQNLQDVTHRDQMIDYNEIYNQYKKVQERTHKKLDD